MSEFLGRVLSLVISDYTHWSSEAAMEFVTIYSLQRLLLILN